MKLPTRPAMRKALRLLALPRNLLLPPTTLLLPSPRPPRPRNPPHRASASLLPPARVRTARPRRSEAARPRRRRRLRPQLPKARSRASMSPLLSRTPTIPRRRRSKTRRLTVRRLRLRKRLEQSNLTTSTRSAISISISISDDSFFPYYSYSSQNRRMSALPQGLERSSRFFLLFGFLFTPSPLSISAFGWRWHRSSTHIVAAAQSSRLILGYNGMEWGWLRCIEVTAFWEVGNLGGT
ncbi:uncharacterized protein BDZ99DRAFT_500944 [Mytilinidion resinicola]|uniref:Uncharacterized protein n=1 Tax=Mytilinidion resinicola TaxID=574789 RepID=A0A6A6YEB8_9PEZI|nr:uncharacterized protein BDZ99DRAFT_500944 [Mytilinidion resinicola]KAF2806908.1 hypothetical protein BDZ99DRAFT_500944 [Mytilinidion resinicola]